MGLDLFVTFVLCTEMHHVGFLGWSQLTDLCMDKVQVLKYTLVSEVVLLSWRTLPRLPASALGLSDWFSQVTGL